MFDILVWNQQVDVYHETVKRTKLNLFPFVCNFSKDNTNGYKYNYDGLGLSQFAEKCYQIFQTRYPNEMHDALHVSPVGWCAEALCAIQDAIKNNSSEITFPNGCCSSPECSINKYYLIVLEESQVKS